MHALNRSQQTKQPLHVVARESKLVLVTCIVCMLMLIVMIVISTWSFTRDLEADYEFVPIHDFLAAESSEELQELLATYDFEGLLDLNE